MRDTGFQSHHLESVMPNPRFHPVVRLLIAVAGAVVALLVVILVLGAIVALAEVVGGRSASQEITGFIQKNLLVSNLLIYPPIFLWLWFCRRFFDRRAFIALGLRAKEFPGQFAGGIICGFLTIAFTFSVLWLSGNIQVRGLSIAAQSGGWQSALPALCGWALMMLCVGFMEEVMFRGYAFHNLNVWLGTRWAIAIQAAVFALIHLTNLAATGKTSPDAVLAAWLAMPNIFLIGVFFALCYLKTGSLWFPIAFHASWNFFLGCVFSLPVSGIPIFQLLEVKVGGSIPLTGGAFGPEASLLLTPILLALIFAASRANDHRQAITDLQSLKKAPEREEIEALPTQEIPMNDLQTEDEEERENRFRTRMGKRQHELDDQTRETLQILNAAKANRESGLTSSTFHIPVEAAPAESTPPTPVPGETVPVESAPVIRERIAPVEATPILPKTEETAPPAPIAPPVLKPNTSPSDKPKPPAPRW